MASFLRRKDPRWTVEDCWLTRDHLGPRVANKGCSSYYNGKFSKFENINMKKQWVYQCLITVGNKF